MNRLKDHFCFAVRYVGMGYVVLWPVSTPAGGDLFGAPLLCTGGSARAFDFLCAMPHPLQLGLGLHVAGTLCALAAVLHLLARAIVRAKRRRQPALPGAAEAAAPVRAAVPARPRLRPGRRPMPPPRKQVEPRTHFGLRGVPQ